MSDIIYGFSRDTVARFWRVILFVERNFLRQDKAGNERTRRPPRTYRRFRLLEQLDAGGSAQVEWFVPHWVPPPEDPENPPDDYDDGTTGTVYARNWNFYGLPGEIGEASPAIGTAGDLEWQVTQNPGQPVYPVLASADVASSSSTGTFTTSIDGEDVEVEVAVPGGAVPSGKKISTGDYGFISHSRGVWHLISLATCRASA